MELDREVIFFLKLGGLHCLKVLVRGGTDPVYLCFIIVSISINASLRNQLCNC